jgi:ribonuclease III
VEPHWGWILSDADLIAALSAIIARPITSPAPYLEALTHGSYADQTGGGPKAIKARDYQRLEFLGDRVLGLIISDALLKAFPDDPEGQLSNRLNALVSRECCADVARSIGLADLIRLGKQARDDGGRDSDNILGDVIEAVLGAIYQDFGLDTASDCIHRWWACRIEAVHSTPKHPKSALQEWAAAHNRRPPEYEVLRREGPPHAPIFIVQARIAKLADAEGSGSSKGDAEKAAAAALLRTVETGNL